jgi:small-conductance mechanosensitive channel
MSQKIQWAMAVLLLGLIGLAVAVLVFTRPQNGSLSATAKNSAAAPAAPIDESAYDTARKISSLAATPGERALGAKSMRISDHIVDLEFQHALQVAAQAPPPTTPRAIRAEKWLTQAQAQVASEQAQVNQLNSLVKRSRGLAQVRAQNHLQVAQAQLSLDQDELSDAKRDLILAGGDEEAQLQQMLAAREKSDHEDESAEKSGEESSEEPAAAAPSSNAPTEEASEASVPRSLFALIGRWNTLRKEKNQVSLAHAAAVAKAAGIAVEHNALDSKVHSAQTKAAAPSGKETKSSAAQSAASTALELSSIRQLRQDQDTLSFYDHETQAYRALIATYVQWIALAGTEDAAALHRLVRSLLWILIVLFAAVVADLLISRLFSKLSLDRSRLHTIRSVLRFSTRGVAAVMILIIIFGPPKQLATILGLVGAGLAVALKDFIVAFFGWFRLIGPNGMRPGDWVEIFGAQQITGVQGKVIEVGLIFTVILESGNWTDAGHPTGRRVAFINSFAIEGCYFNFTTAGQWLWDEVQVGLPAGPNPYPVLEALQKAAEKETASNASLAEQDWNQAMSGSGISNLSAKPVMTVRPTEAGLNVVIRYIARADDREETRQRLYHAAFETLREVKHLPAAPAEATPSPEPA